MLEKRGISKVETVSETYLASSILSFKEDGTTHIPEKSAFDCLLFALDCLRSFKKTGFTSKKTNENPLIPKIGMHTGDVISGVIGTKKPQYALIGDTVNTSSRMKSTGEQGKVHMSKDTYDLIIDYLPLVVVPNFVYNPDEFDWLEQTKTVKGKGEMTTFLLNLYPASLVNISVRESEMSRRTFVRTSAVSAGETPLQAFASGKILTLPGSVDITTSENVEETITLPHTVKNQQSGRVESGDGSGRVESGDGSGRVESGDGSRRVESGDGSGRVESGDGSGRVESGDGSGTIADSNSIRNELVSSEYEVLVRDNSDSIKNERGGIRKTVSKKAKELQGRLLKQLPSGIQNTITRDKSISKKSFNFSSLPENQHESSRVSISEDSSKFVTTTPLHLMSPTQTPNINALATPEMIAVTNSPARFSTSSSPEQRFAHSGSATNIIANMTRKISRNYDKQVRVFQNVLQSETTDASGTEDEKQSDVVESVVTGTTTKNIATSAYGMSRYSLIFEDWELERTFRRYRFSEKTGLMKRLLYGLNIFLCTFYFINILSLYIVTYMIQTIILLTVIQQPQLKKQFLFTTRAFILIMGMWAAYYQMTVHNRHALLCISALYICGCISAIFTPVLFFEDSNECMIHSDTSSTNSNGTIIIAGHCIQEWKQDYVSYGNELEILLWFSLINNVSASRFPHLVVVTISILVLSICVKFALVETSTAFKSELALFEMIFALVNLLSAYFKEKWNRIIFANNREIKMNHERSSRLVDEMMPSQIVADLKSKQRNEQAYEYDNMTILFADIVGYTSYAKSVPANQVVQLLSYLFSTFDDLTTEHGVYKVCTIGDCYVAVSEPEIKVLPSQNAETTEDPQSPIEDDVSQPKIGKAKSNTGKQESIGDLESAPPINTKSSVESSVESSVKFSNHRRSKDDLDVIEGGFGKSGKSVSVEERLKTRIDEIGVSPIAAKIKKTFGFKKSGTLDIFDSVPSNDDTRQTVADSSGVGGTIRDFFQKGASGMKAAARRTIVSSTGNFSAGRKSTVASTITLNDTEYSPRSPTVIAPDLKAKVQSAERMIVFALGMIAHIKKTREQMNVNLKMRIGMHFGKFVGGVIGTKKIRFDIWGKDVLIGNTIESNGQPDHIVVSQPLREFLTENFPNRFIFKFHKTIDSGIALGFRLYRLTDKNHMTDHDVLLTKAKPIPKELLSQQYVKSGMAAMDFGQVEVVPGKRGKFTFRKVDETANTASALLKPNLVRRFTKPDASSILEGVTQNRSLIRGISERPQASSSLFRSTTTYQRSSSGNVVASSPPFDTEHLHPPSPDRKSRRTSSQIVLSTGDHEMLIQTLKTNKQAFADATEQEEKKKRQGKASKFLEVSGKAFRSAGRRLSFFVGAGGAASISAAASRNEPKSTTVNMLAPIAENPNEPKSNPANMQARSKMRGKTLISPKPRG